jgi:hypothetical protein
MRPDPPERGFNIGCGDHPALPSWDLTVRVGYLL